jgi:hypothetical protein
MGVMEGWPGYGGGGETAAAMAIVTRTLMRRDHPKLS